MASEIRWGVKTRQDSVTAGRDIILAAARKCYEEKGISKTTIDDIAIASKVNRRTVYRYFENKKQIIQSVIDEHIIDFFDELSTQFASYEADFPEFLKAFIRDVVMNGPMDPSHALFMGHRNAEISKQYYFTSEIAPDLFEELLGPAYQQAIDKGIVSGSIEYEDLSLWVSRIIFSYIQFPVEPAVLDKELDLFVLACLKNP